jgi:hypothetical protein
MARSCELADGRSRMAIHPSVLVAASLAGLERLGLNCRTGCHRGDDGIKDIRRAADVLLG